jgi:hypothetical protein
MMANGLVNGNDARWQDVDISLDKRYSSMPNRVFCFLPRSSGTK